MSSSERVTLSLTSRIWAPGWKVLRLRMQSSDASTSRASSRCCPADPTTSVVASVAWVECRIGSDGKAASRVEEAASSVGQRRAELFRAGGRGGGE